MRGFSPALVVMLVGVALVIAAGVAWASSPRLGEVQPGNTAQPVVAKRASVTGVHTVRGVTMTLVARASRGGHAT